MKDPAKLFDMIKTVFTVPLIDSSVGEESVGRWNWVIKEVLAAGTMRVRLSTFDVHIDIYYYEYYYY